MSAAIAVAGLVKRFGEETAVDRVELTVNQGEIFGLIGPDGAGKTTLMRMLVGILPPTAGTATVAGREVVADPEGVKQRIGYLSQRFSLYGDLTVEENLDFVARLYRVPADQAAPLKEQMLTMTGLAPFRERQARRLSGGMKQKLGLMCALIHRPEVLLLDEPTTGVDPVSRRDFYRILAGLPEEGVTVLLSSPYMDEAQRCHRLALMARGRILAGGTTAELTEAVPGVMLEVVTAQVRGAETALRELPGLLGLTPFGDALHVRLAEGGEPVAAVRSRLDSAGVPVTGIEVIEPSVEDAFVALLGEEAAAGHG